MSASQKVGMHISLGFFESVLLAVPILVLSFFLTRGTKTTESAHEMEEKNWALLKSSGRHAVADILMLARPGNRLVVWRNGSPEMAAAELRVRFLDEAGAAHEAVMKTFIDEELLANFTRGKQLPIVYAADDPARVAIDRERVQVAFSDSSE